jgi:hypothetical protein
MSGPARLACLVVLATLTGCSAIKLSYNKLDWIAAWQLSRFVDLEPEQQALFDARFRDFWQWHRGTQLSLYAKDLREVAVAVDKPLAAAQIEQYLKRSQDHLGRALQEIVPDTARVLQTFDDDQVAELLENMAERREDRARESADLTLEELQEEAQDQMIRNLKRWIGRPNREQQRRIEDWSRERKYAGTVWHQYQEAWARAFTDVLAHRRDPDFQQRLAALFDNARLPYDEEMAKVQKHNRTVWIGVMADLSAMLTAAQRAELQTRLRELAADFDELAARPQQAAATQPR